MSDRWCCLWYLVTGTDGFCRAVVDRGDTQTGVKILWVWFAYLAPLRLCPVPPSGTGILIAMMDWLLGVVARWLPTDVGRQRKKTAFRAR
ncbi:hypothetical protein B0T18DRAFT_419949 [Schizothecium vesticola]|uniref:Uncharacterized protein n=1 Tax=Schizothecium vesticola TaxID=314040 RepID=A0AA40K0E2_9PEZI|nr:hypothetical protein B0T18DRAFT_419949 [Schizothecium vesticola]